MKLNLRIEANGEADPDLASDMTVPMTAAAQAADEYVSQRFETETDHEGKPFAPVSKAWARLRKPGKILTQDGLLKASWIVTPDAAGLTFSSGMITANRLNYGGNGIPERLIVGPGFGEMGPSKELMEEIDDTILDWIEMEFSDES